MLAIKIILVTIFCSLKSIGNESLATYQDCLVKLIDAAERDDLKTVEKILKSGCDANGKIKIGPEHWTCALRNTVHHSNAKMVELLLKYGANPNLDLGRNMTPFHYAAGASSTSVFNLLFKHKGNINTKNDESGYKTPLIWAIAEGKIQNVQFMIDRGIILNPDSINGFVSPLATAVSHRQFEITQLLISNGADINKVFSEGSDDCISCPYGITIMHRIVDMYNNEGKETTSRFIDLILSYKPNLNIESQMGFTPLDHACLGRDIELVDKLIENGAILKTTNSSALHSAAMLSKHEIVSLLIKKGADSNWKDKNGNTPLIIAYECCVDGFGDGITLEDRVRTIEILLDNNADPTIRNHEGQSFTDKCKNEARPELKNLLIKRGILKNWDEIKK